MRVLSVLPLGCAGIGALCTADYKEELRRSPARDQVGQSETERAHCLRNAEPKVYYTVSPPSQAGGTTCRWAGQALVRVQRGNRGSHGASLSVLRAQSQAPGWAS